MDALSVLQRLGTGQLLEELHAAITNTATEVVATGNPGKVTLTLTLTTQDQGDPTIIIAPSIGRTMPKRDVRAAIFFSIDGDLHRDDPRQARLDFRTVDTTTGEIRDLANEREERAIR